VLQDLHYPRAETRSNAAIILGRVPTAANTAALQQAFAAETDARARLSLAYALLEHGQDQQLQPLYEPLKSCPSPNCDQAVQLLQWTSAEKKKMIDPTLIVPVLNNRSVPAVTRLLAAWLLHDFAYLNILTEESLDALLLASTETAEERVADKAIEGVRIATLLDRARVRQMLDQNHVARRALLIRLSDIATEEDLAYLESQYYKTSQQDDAVRSAIVAGIGRIPGQPAAQLLIRWFEKYPANRENIAFALINRNDIDPTQLARLAALANDVGTLVLKLQLQTADAIPSAKFLLRRGDINARIQTALIVGRVHLADVLDDLWDLASYRNYAYYPSDSFVRRAALSAILEIVVDQRLRQEIRETPTPSPAPTPTPSPTPTPVPPAH
jgi:hypothetical protein